MKLHAALARHVELPANPDQRVPLPGEKAIAEVILGRRIEIAACGAGESREQALVAAIRHFDQRDAIASSRVLRLQDIEVGRELDESLAVFLRLLEIDHDGISRVRGIDGEIDRADEFLVAGHAHIGTPDNLDADDFGPGSACEAHQNREGENCVLHSAASIVR